MAVPITRTDYSIAELRRLASKTRDADRARRLLALALVMEGCSRAQAALMCGMDRQTLRDWVHRFNEHGVEGLSDLAHSGRKPALSSAQEAELAEIIRQGPSIDEHGVVRWRRVDLRDVIEAKFGLHFHERSVGKILHKLGFSHVSVRPRHPRSDAQTQEAFKKTSPHW